MDERFASGGLDRVSEKLFRRAQRGAGAGNDSVGLPFYHEYAGSFQWLRMPAQPSEREKRNFGDLRFGSISWTVCGVRWRKRAKLAEKVCELTEHLPSIVSKAQKDREQISALLRSMEEEFSPQKLCLKESRTSGFSVLQHRKMIKRISRRLKIW